MAQVTSAAMPNGMGASALSRRGPRLAGTLVELWRGLVRALRDPYRPELHYMRGPGPKWHEKHPGA